MRYNVILLVCVLSCFVVNCQQSYDTTSLDAKSYKVVEGSIQQTETNIQFSLVSNSDSEYFSSIIKELVVQVTYETTERVQIKIYDKNGTQAVVPNSPLGVVRPDTQIQTGQRRSPGKRTNYSFNYTMDPFGFQIIRTLDHSILFDTTDLAFVFESQYLEISTHLPVHEAHIYGLGQGFKAPENSVTTIFARHANNSHPFYMDIRNNGLAFGTLLLNANGMDIITFADRITFKAIGGIFEFYFFVPEDGTPDAVVQSYTTFIGRSMLPAHWALGFHDCVQTKLTFDEIPIESHCVDMNTVMYQQDRKKIGIVNSAISVNDTFYKQGQALDVFIKNVDAFEYQGLGWTDYAVYPDWWHANITHFWDNYIASLMNTSPLDGLEISMNQPTSFCLGSCGSQSQKPPFPWLYSPEEQERIHATQKAALDAMAGETYHLLYPNYTIHHGLNDLSDKTVAMNAKHSGNIRHYDVHSLYGHASGYFTRNAILNYNSTLRPFLFSQSTFVGSGQYMGHVSHEMYTWESLALSIPKVLNFQMLGIVFSGISICRFQDEELCIRWIQVGAFYPFARTSDTWNTDHTESLWTNASRTVLEIRYTLLPYFYTLFEEAHRLGTGVWRPLVFEYPMFVNELSDNAQQFLIGSDLMILPVLTQGATQVKSAQFPPGIWYDWYGNHSVVSIADDHVQTLDLDAPLLHIPVCIRGGAIIATKTSTFSVKDTFDTPYRLIIALDKNYQALGRLYMDDGYSSNKSNNVNFVFTNNTLSVNGQFGFSETEYLDRITIISHDKAFLDQYTNATLILNQHKIVNTILTKHTTFVSFDINNSTIAFTERFSLVVQLV
ncbi:glycosyl hydrolases family 31-domain-containing protein [Gilbertella persicaria]|uniref:glycosyl hydrolases family 31-domain-containing protein n=1 Tax=Gilbertella persicaria TaxID=101096 RepID=UPI00221FB48D|nr:glycosyl hydrolases family 31-domain-containing protein [Gilbertella persicaria]KAI8098249.1 glycosyl hydrolases family 31-domain-containing protein [Gilbertella persicaria]